MASEDFGNEASAKSIPDAPRAASNLSRSSYQGLCQLYNNDPLRDSSASLHENAVNLDATSSRIKVTA